MTEFERMIQFLDLAYKRKDQIVPCLIGPVGIGKTAAVMQHAENVKAKNVVTIIASQILPSEVSGITMPDSGTKSMEIYDHYKLSSLKDGDILFFDELLEADQCVLSACLTLIESRMMMSGKKLPDIQIIAATNPTVNPANIKENIRQRFMFCKFNIDRIGVKNYIFKNAGFYPPDSVLGRLTGSGNDFNILSPRSLTKLCEWMATATNKKEAQEIAGVINNMYDSSIGNDIAREYLSIRTPEMQARRAMYDAYTQIYDDSKYSQQYFKETSMDELFDMLKNSPDWSKIEELLSSQVIEDNRLEINF